VDAGAGADKATGADKPALDYAAEAAATPSIGVMII